MEFIRFDNASNDSAFAGNKAARLAELRAAGFRVPAFFYRDFVVEEVL